MTPEEKKAKLLGKLNEPAKPILTQVVRVEESKKVGRPEKAKAEETEHVNAYLPKTLAMDVRMYKLKTGMTMIDIINEALTEYLAKHGGDWLTK